MPRINRIRIINFSYNNDARKIIDETFDFYDGENVLLNLSNGGGKSVMVQLMMQPILPDLTIQKRKMTDYIRYSTSPVFVILEWILDNLSVKDYLMTGIAIAPKSAVQSEESNKINYFTFASHYDQACDFDLASLPFVRMEGNRMVLLPFERSREAVKNLVSSHREMFYYGREDVGSYQKLLLSFGISREEWKNVIAGMNNDEGGIDELFERCKTSDSIFDEWILKNIEKTQLAGEAGGTEIEALLSGLVSDTIKNEEYIKAQKIISDYMGKHRDIERALEEVCRSLETLKHAEKELSGMYQAVIRCQKRAEEESEELEASQRELEKQQSHIRMEEASERYYEANRVFEEVSAQAEEKTEKQAGLGRLLGEQRFLLECLQAARIMEECHGIQGNIDGILMKTEASKGDTAVKERMDNLAYSLNLQYEERCKALEDRMEALEESLKQLEQTRKELGDRETQQQNLRNSLHSQAGILETETGRFGRYEDGVFKTLQTSFLRNILKELEQAGVEKFASGLKKQLAREEGRAEWLKTREEEIKDRLAELSVLLAESNQEIYQTEHSLHTLESEMETYEAWKKRAEELLLKYEIPSKYLFEPDVTGEMLEQKIRQQESQKYQLLLDRQQVADMLLGIRQHHVYIPEILLKFLEKQDIPFQTGESYLGNLDEGKRSHQLSQNPLLPFGILLRERDKKRLYEIPVEQCFLRQAVPVFTYEQLDFRFSSANRVVKAGDQVEVISSYEERIFEDALRADYVRQLCATEEEQKTLIQHREEELKQLRTAAAFLQEMEYEKDSEKALTERLLETGKALESLKDRKSLWEQEQESLSQEEKQNEAMLENSQETILQVRNKQVLLNEYLERNEEYQKQYGQLCTVKEELQRAGEEIKKLHISLENCRREEITQREGLPGLKYQLKLEREAAAKYQDAKPAVLLEESFFSMEREYRQLVENLDDSLNALSKELEEQRLIYEKKTEELSELPVTEDDYKGLSFDKEEYTAKKAYVKALEKEEAEEYADLLECSSRLGDAKARREAAGRRLGELGLSQPLPEAEIRQDYERRIKEVKALLDGLEKRRGQLRDLHVSCRETAGRIEDMDVPFVSNAGFVLEDDWKEQFKELREGLKEAKSAAASVKKTSAVLYRNVCLEYKEKNQCVTDILKSLEQLNLEAVNLSYESVYFSAEEFIKKRESLVKLLDFYNGQLENIVHTKNQIVDQCVSYARMIYDDVKLIVKKSRVQLSGKNRPVQMIKVGIPEELDSEARNRMAYHIDESLRILTELGKSEAISEKKWREKLSLFMSARELFNQLIGTNKVPVYVYKIDLSDRGSGLKLWEHAMIQNSGGEKVVAFFTVISTLISYIRDMTRQHAGEAAGQESKVIIMDNPFGRTSSEHLLKAMMDIARTFQIQLICLSDLNQSSITNRFSLIYQLSIRKQMYSDKEILKSESVRMNKAGMVKNERLEHAGVYETGEQRTLWEFMQEI